MRPATSRPTDPDAAAAAIRALEAPETWRARVGTGTSRSPRGYDWDASAAVLLEVLQRVVRRRSVSRRAARQPRWQDLGARQPRQFGRRDGEHRGRAAGRRPHLGQLEQGLVEHRAQRRRVPERRDRADRVAGRLLDRRGIRLADRQRRDARRAPRCRRGSGRTPAPAAGRRRPRRAGSSRSRRRRTRSPRPPRPPCGWIRRTRAPRARGRGARRSRGTARRPAGSSPTSSRASTAFCSSRSPQSVRDRLDRDRVVESDQSQARRRRTGSCAPSRW